MKMKIFILNLILFSIGNLAVAYDGGTLSVGYHSCAIDDESVKCWGNGHDETKIPPLKNPTSVSVGGNHTCAIDDEGVKCWGDNYYGQTKVPILKNPISISAASAHTCAIDKIGLKCWGINDKHQTDVPHLKNPISVSAGMYHTCAIDDEGVKCWGGNSWGQADVPPLKNPTSVSAGREHTCAIDDDGVKCWGRPGRRINVPFLKNPTFISSGAYHSCAIDDEGVKCWGNDSYDQPKVPPLANPTSVSVGVFHTCALDDEGLKCWGYDSNVQPKIPPLIFFWLNRLEILIDRLAQWSTPVRTSFFNSLKPFAKDNLKSIGTSQFPDQIVHGQYILIALLKSSIETGDSAYYIEKVISAYISRMNSVSEQSGIYGLDQVQDFPLTRLTTLKVMQTSLSTMTEFLAAEDKAHIQSIIKLIGTAMTDVANKQLIIKALTAIDTNEAIINKLTQSPKTHFLVVTLKNAQQWLNTKIK